MLDRIKKEFTGWKKWRIAWMILANGIILGVSIYMGDTALGILTSLTGVTCVILCGMGKISNYFFGTTNTIKNYNNPQSPLCRKYCLNETAFILKPNQYGRILWNERTIDWDTGEWYYYVRTYNILFLPDGISRADIFVADEPDFIYKQMVVL